jgi:APA family basic amino acid/polyamine antiporter
MKLPASAVEPSAASLDRRLGPFDAAAIVVSNVIGGGIFFVPVIVAQLVPDPRAVLLIWAVGGALAFAGAMAYAELAALRPRAGGEYVYLYEAYGPLVGFLTGWTSFVAGFSGAIAASAVALAEYLGRFIPAAKDVTPIVALPLPYLPLAVSRESLVALALIAALTLAAMLTIVKTAIRSPAPKLNRRSATVSMSVCTRPSAPGSLMCASAWIGSA